MLKIKVVPSSRTKVGFPEVIPFLGHHRRRWHFHVPVQSNGWVAGLSVGPAVTFAYFWILLLIIHLPLEVGEEKSYEKSNCCISSELKLNCISSNLTLDYFYFLGLFNTLILSSIWSTIQNVNITFISSNHHHHHQFLCSHTMPSPTWLDMGFHASVAGTFCQNFLHLHQDE